ncbi:protein deglycase HchA [Frigidibacter albus]|uniref:Protein deglycase HchA n=1 Tax=Frigidibacter albus TaxID=1465486 RepID=A0A6L8VLT7_9RHOB|nr:glyoxalase III HchA [Frigidibacter albus]MZQ91034.1 protein deglycase HchA [Frigidibacter albus]NBE32919.1 protein deglycase HchA [Frigidibacter albus]GGH62155.1 protein deglycase HchA [Frigidibacter albus]
MSVPMMKSSQPTPDPERANAFEPSPLSLRLFTQKKTNLKGADYPAPYAGGRWKILVIGSDQKYLKMANGTWFSTGNHPVETLLPMYHLAKAGFGFDIATVSGAAVEFEHWAMPTEDAAVQGFYQSWLGKFDQPRTLADVVATSLGPDSDYIGVFIPGGHGALMGLPEDPNVKAVLQWAASHNRFVISLCHGPAAFLALGKDNPFRGRKICAFADRVDAHTPKIGYMPGKLTWKFGEHLTAQGFTITNKLISGATCKDGRLLTGDSPLASNALGKLAATELLAAVKAM